MARPMARISCLSYGSTRANCCLPVDDLRDRALSIATRVDPKKPSKFARARGERNRNLRYRRDRGNRPENQGGNKNENGNAHGGSVNCNSIPVYSNVLFFLSPFRSNSL